MKAKETKLDRPMGGLFMLIIFTTIWTLLAEYYFNDYDYRITGILFGLTIIFFIYYYLRFKKKKVSLLKVERDKSTKKKKNYFG